MSIAAGILAGGIAMTVSGKTAYDQAQAAYDRDMDRWWDDEIEDMPDMPSVPTSR